MAQEELLPFWQKKPKLQKQILDQRKVVVSVDVESQGRERKIRIVGVGALNVPLYFAVDQVQRYEELSKVSSYFQKVKHDKEKQEVYFFIKALGKQIRFVQRYKWGKQTPDEAQLDWEVKSGTIKGMVGHYKLRKISALKTEISIWASLKKMDIPLPEFLINFTLEVIAEKTAQKMRAYIEDNYRQAKEFREQYVKTK